MTYVKKTLILLFGLLAISLASALLMIAGLGGDAITIINQGTSTFLHIDIAWGTLINNGILFLIGALLGGVFDVSSIISVIIVGPLINLFLYLLNKTNLISQTKKELEG